MNASRAAWGLMAVTLICGAMSVVAQEAKTGGIVPWDFACTAVGAAAPLQCRMTQELFATESRQRVLAITVTAAPGGTSSVEMTLALPHGALLPPGLALKIDEQEPVKVAIESSNAAGVYARVALDGELGTAVKRGQQMTVGVTNRAGKLVQIPVSLAGFSAALKRLTALR